MFEKKDTDRILASAAECRRLKEIRNNKGAAVAACEEALAQARREEDEAHAAHRDACHLAHMALHGIAGDDESA